MLPFILPFDGITFIAGIRLRLRYLEICEELCQTNTVIMQFNRSHARMILLQPRLVEQTHIFLRLKISINILIERGRFRTVMRCHFRRHLRTVSCLPRPSPNCTPDDVSSKSKIELKPFLILISCNRYGCSRIIAILLCHAI